MSKVTITTGFMTITTKDAIYEIMVTGGTDYTPNSSFLATANKMFHKFSNMDLIPIGEYLYVSRKAVLKMEYSDEISWEHDRAATGVMEPQCKSELLSTRLIPK